MISDHHSHALGPIKLLRTQKLKFPDRYVTKQIFCLFKKYVTKQKMIRSPNRLDIR